MAFLLGVKALLTTPTFLILGLANGAWISTVISVAVAFVGLVGWLKWSNVTSRMGFLPALRKTLGSRLGTAVCAVVTFSLLINISWSMRLFAGGAVIGLLPQFPIEVLIITLIGASAYAAWLGLENVARAADFFFAPTVASFVLVIAAGASGLDMRNLLPLFGPGPGAVALQGLRYTGLWGVVVAFVALKPYVRSESDLARGTQKGLLAAGIGLVIAVLAVLLFFPYPYGTRLGHPMGILARSVYLGRFLQRLEALFVFTWFFPSAVQASYLYFALLAFTSELAGTRTYRPFLPALASLSFAIAALPVSTLLTAELLQRYFFDTFGNAFMVLGWVLYGVARVRGMKPSPESNKAGGDTTGTKGQEGKSGGSLNLE